PVDVELSGRHLEEPLLAHGLARLAHQPDVLVVVGDHAHRARVGDDLALGLRPVRVAEAVDAHVRDPALVLELAGDPLHRTASIAVQGAVAARPAPAASAAAKKSGSWSIVRPFVR